VWGYNAEQHADTRVVDVHISRLRLKLEDDPEKSRIYTYSKRKWLLFQRIAQLEH
jgi:OmpR family response regulator RpaB